MTASEYQRKRDNIARSDADVSIKAKAILDLDAEYGITYSSAVDLARKQYEESQPDLPKGDD